MRIVKFLGMIQKDSERFEEIFKASERFEIFKVKF